jgi:dephospho-CoA kinase
VFADPEKKLALEQILHPRIRGQWALEAERRRNSTEIFLADIPLLYETGGETLCDRVAVVACSPRVQLERLMTRSTLERTGAEQMIAAQMPLAEKMRRADHVVWNNGPLASLTAQAEMLVALWTRSS